MHTACVDFTPWGTLGYMSWGNVNEAPRKRATDTCADVSHMCQCNRKHLSTIPPGWSMVCIVEKLKMKFKGLCPVSQSGKEQNCQKTQKEHRNPTFDHQFTVKLILRSGM